MVLLFDDVARLADLAEDVEHAALSDLEDEEDARPPCRARLVAPAQAVAEHDVVQPRGDGLLQSVAAQSATADAVAVTAQPAERHEARQATAMSAAIMQLSQEARRAAAAPRSPHAREGMQRPAGLLYSPQAMSRPFANLMGSAERQRIDMHRASVANARHVFCPGYGVLPVVAADQLNAQPVMLQHDRAAGLSLGSAVAAPEASAPAPQLLTMVGAAAASQHGQAVAVPPVVPQLRCLRSVQQFWELWQNGNSLNGHSAIKDLPADVRKAQKQRFSEWKRAADEVQRLLAAIPGASSSSSAAMAKLLHKLDSQRIRDKQSMPAFIKALGKERRDASA